MSANNIYTKLLNIQTKLKAPKNQYNSFGKYNYRSCEDILEGLKPLLDECNATLILDDEIVQIGDRFYVKATATLIDIEKGENIKTTAFAREDENKKGMDLAQVTGSVSSYARKYALNGLFCIDDTKDSDGTNKHDKDDPKPKKDNKPSESNKTSKNNNSDLISRNQAKRMYAIGKGNVDLIKKIMVTYGYTESAQIKKSDYNNICSEIETQIKIS
ncbi:MAG: ERF family protein [Candidatus Thorarchaeota archaeon]